MGAGRRADSGHRPVGGAVVRALRSACAELSLVGPKVMLARYFGALDDNLDLTLSLPVAGLHLDPMRASAQVLAAGCRWG